MKGLLAFLRSSCTGIASGFASSIATAGTTSSHDTENAKTQKNRKNLFHLLIDLLC